MAVGPNDRKYNGFGSPVAVRGEIPAEEADVSQPPTRRIWDGFEAQLLHAFEEVFDASGLDPHDDFFELGGDSITALRLTGRLSTRFEDPPTIAELFEHSTIEELATLLRSRERTPAGLSTVVPLASERSGALPLVFVHAVTGEVLHAVSLSPLRLDRPLLLIRSVGLDGETPPLRTVGEMVARYEADLAAALPAPGPVALAGYSVGGLIALKLAARLRENGYQVPVTIMIGALPPSALSGHDVSREEWMVKRLWQIVRRAHGVDTADRLAARLRSDGTGGIPPVLPELVETLRREQFVPPDVGVAQLTARLEVFAANMEATLACDLPSYDGAVVAIRAANDPAVDWSRLLSGPVSCHSVDSPHDDMLLGGSEAVSLMSEVLDRYDQHDRTRGDR